MNDLPEKNVNYTSKNNPGTEFRDFFFCSLLGAIIIVSGFYGVMWGKVKEQREVEQCELKKSSEKVPLLG